MDKQGVLREYFGHIGFRQGQEALVDALLDGQDVLGVMPTGAGKSICYQVPALMQEGVALVISPLISLMCDQVAALRAAGAPAAYINSSLTPAQQARALERAAQGQYKIIYVAPERLDAPDFLAFAQSASISLVAVDEAHCVSQWGQDFRPSYLRIPTFIQGLPNRPPVGAFTATATPAVKADIIRLLQLRQPYVAVTGFDRPNLRFINQKPKNRFAALLEVVERHPEGSGIVYCATRKTVQQVCDQLRLAGYPATRYHAGLSDQERQENQADFQYDRRTIMVATNAFGMGIDKSNVSYVVHYNMPKNLESYYQEAGRAGRDGSPAECVLLYGGQDVITARWLIEHGEDNPDLDEAQRRLLRQRDLDRLRQMTFYATSRRCLRAFILDYFGERAPDGCGNCSVCLDMPFETVQNDVILQKARTSRSARRAKETQEKDPLMTALKALRKQLAAQRGLPAYLVFSDATLRDMACKRPGTLEDMLKVNGVGAAKCRQYGQAFLDVLAGIGQRPGAGPLPGASYGGRPASAYSLKNRPDGQDLGAPCPAPEAPPGVPDWDGMEAPDLGGGYAPDWDGVFASDLGGGYVLADWEDAYGPHTGGTYAPDAPIPHAGSDGSALRRGDGAPRVPEGVSPAARPWTELEEEQLRLELLGGGTLEQLSAIHRRSPQDILARQKRLGM